jgi:hypothetical protein
MGKSTISMAISNSYVKLPEGSNQALSIQLVGIFSESLWNGMQIYAVTSHESHAQEGQSGQMASPLYGLREVHPFHHIATCLQWCCLWMMFGSWYAMRFLPNWILEGAICGNIINIIINYLYIIIVNLRMQTSFQLSHDPFLTSARAHLLGVVGLTALKVRRWCRGWAEEDRGQIQAPHTRWRGNRQATGGDCECRGKITGHTFEMGGV